MCDSTEAARREMVTEINSVEGERAQLEAEHGQVWNTTELQTDYSVVGFMAPFVVVVRKADGVKGSLLFQHSPRFYFDFKAA
jgi:hypothetical protein